MKECEFIGPEEVAQKMDEIIRLSEIEVQLKAYLWDCSQIRKGLEIGFNPFNLDSDELKSLIHSARKHRVEVSHAQDTILKGMEEWVLCEAVGLSLSTFEFRGDVTALQILELVLAAKEKVVE